MKEKLVKIIKVALGDSYYYYRYNMKSKFDKVNTNDKVNRYKNEEVLIMSVDDPNGGKSVGGKHIHLYLLMKGLTENKISNYILTCNNGYHRSVKKQEVMDLFGISEVQLKRIKDIEFAFITCGWIKELQEDLRVILKGNKRVKYINSHDIISTVAAKKTLEELDLDIPIITTLHGYFSDENVDYGGLDKDGLLYKLFRELEQEAYNCSNKIITVDNRIKNYVKSKSNKRDSDISVIVNAIDHFNFAPIEEKECNRLLEKYGYKERIIFVPRRLVPKNGVKYVVEAVNILVKENLRNFKLIVAGDGVERLKIDKYIEENNLTSFVELLGDINHDKILDYFKFSKIIAVPSVKSNNVEEATSLAALEGMAVGKVIIATKIGGLKELIRNDENGFLVNEKDPVDMANSIRKVLTMNEKEYLRIAKNARKQIVEKHGYINHSLDFYKVFQSTIGEKNEGIDYSNMV